MRKGGKLYHAGKGTGSLCIIIYMHPAPRGLKAVFVNPVVRVNNWGQERLSVIKIKMYNSNCCYSEGIG